MSMRMIDRMDMGSIIDDGDVSVGNDEDDEYNGNNFIKFYICL